MPMSSFVQMGVFPVAIVRGTFVPSVELSHVPSSAAGSSRGVYFSRNTRQLLCSVHISAATPAPKRHDQIENLGSVVALTLTTPSRLSDGAPRTKAAKVLSQEALDSIAPDLAHIRVTARSAALCPGPCDLCGTRMDRGPSVLVAIASTCRNAINRAPCRGEGRRADRSACRAAEDSQRRAGTDQLGRSRRLDR